MSNIDTFIHLSTEEPNQYKQKVGGGELKNNKETKKSLFTDRSPDSTDKSLKVT